jgi:hypothetical protein
MRYIVRLGPNEADEQVGHNCQELPFGALWWYDVDGNAHSAQPGTWYKKSDTTPRKSPYNDKEKYTEEAVRIADEFHHALQPIFDKYVAQGYAIRQLSHMALSEVWELELLAMLDGGAQLIADTKVPEGKRRRTMEDPPGGYWIEISPTKPLPTPKPPKDMREDDPPKGIRPALECTGLPPHRCGVTGPCNGFPRKVTP